MVLGLVVHGSAGRLCMYVRSREPKPLWVETGSLKANGGDTKCCLGQVFNCQVGILLSAIAWYTQAHPTSIVEKSA